MKRCLEALPPIIRALAEHNVDMPDSANEANARLMKLFPAAPSMGFRVPFNWHETRTAGLTAGGATAGATLVGTEIHPELAVFAPVAPTFDSLGVKFIQLKSGQNVLLPGMSAPPTVGWVGESVAGSAGAGSSQATALAPCIATTNWTESGQFSLQIEPEINDFLQEGAMQALAAARATAMLAGTGGTQPTGLTGATGVQTSVGTSFDFTKATHCERLLLNSKGFVDPTTLGWAMAPDVYETLRNREIVTGGTRRIIDHITNRMLGYPVVATAAAPAGSLFFGSWSQAAFVLWPFIDLMRDPYYSSTTRDIRITVWMFLNVYFRRPDQFVYVSGVS